MEGINPDQYLSRFQVKKPHTPRTPREEQLDRAAEITGWTIKRVCGATRHFPPDPLYTNWLKSLNDDALTGKNPAALWQHILKKTIMK
jgi:hypothetical protein